MKLQALGYSLIANVVLLIAGGFCAWQWAESGEECKGDQARAVVAANTEVREEEGERDEALDTAERETKAETRAELVEVETGTNERAASIERVPVSGDCRAPVGLPDLGPAVDQANAAAGE